MSKAKRYQLVQTLYRQEEQINLLSGHVQKVKRDLILLLGLRYEDYPWEDLMAEAARQIKGEQQ